MRAGCEQEIWQLFPLPLQMMQAGQVQLDFGPDPAAATAASYEYEAAR